MRNNLIKGKRRDVLSWSLRVKALNRPRSPFDWFLGASEGISRGGSQLAETGFRLGAHPVCGELLVPPSCVCSLSENFKLSPVKSPSRGKGLTFFLDHRQVACCVVVYCILVWTAVLNCDSGTVTVKDFGVFVHFRNSIDGEQTWGAARSVGLFSQVQFRCMVGRTPNQSS